MARLSLILVCLALALSTFALILDSKSEQGLLNLIGEKKADNSGAAKVVKKNPGKLPPEGKKVLHKEENPSKHPSKDAEQQEEPASASGESGRQIPFIVCIDPGHQAKANTEQEPIGPGAAETKNKVTYGTTGVATNKPEYVLNLEAANILKDMLEKEGIQVIMTRTSHDVDISNRERAEIANRNQADLFIRVHADGSENPNTKGFSVLVPGVNNPYTTNIYKDSYQAGQMIVDRVLEKNYTLLGNGLFPREDLSGFNWSNVPVILLELGFMTNPEEDRLLSDAEHLSNILQQVTLGVIDYAGHHGKIK